MMDDLKHVLFAKLYGLVQAYSSKPSIMAKARVQALYSVVYEAGLDHDYRMYQLERMYAETKEDVAHE